MKDKIIALLDMATEEQLQKLYYFIRGALKVNKG